MIRRAAGLVAAGLVAASGAAGAAGEPRSAIPWLSESIRTDVPAPPPRPAGPAPTRGSEEITVTPLGTVRRDSVGLLPPERSGLPRDLWGPTPTGQAESLIRDHPDTGVPAARALFRKILLAETDPPQPALADGALLVARVDRLLEIGALEEARALIELAGPETPELFRRWFDVARERIPLSEKVYTWWSYRAADWAAADRGRRLDHIWVSEALRGTVRDFRITRDARGWERPSDHVPVTAVFDV